MRFLRYNTDQRITVGPFLDKTDGITPEITLTVTACWLTFIVDTANVPTLILDVAATASAGANDMVHVASDVAGYYDLELAAANVAYYGRATLSINDVATHCPVFHEFMILPQKVYDSLILNTDNIEVDAVQLLGTAWTAPATAGLPDCNIKEISADATAADNLEAACDGTTYNVGGGAVIAASVTAKTGYELSTAGILAIWHQAVAQIVTASTIGKLIVDYLNAPIGTVQTDVTAIKSKTDMFPVIWFAP